MFSSANKDCIVIKRHSTMSFGNIIYIHGYNSSWHETPAFLKALYDKGYNIYAIDLPNHGYNNGYKLQQHFREYCMYVKKWILSLKINGERNILMGHSMGGGIVAAIANKLPTISDVVLIAPLQKGATIKLAARTIAAIAKNKLLPIYNKYVKVKGNPSVQQLKLLLEITNKSTITKIENGLKKMNKDVLLIFGTEDIVIPASLSVPYIRSVINPNIKLTYKFVVDGSHWLNDVRFYKKCSLIIDEYCNGLNNNSMSNIKE